MSDYGLSRAQAAYDAMTPREAGPCPKCEAEEWRQKVLSLLEDAPMSDCNRDGYMDRLRELAAEVADDVDVYVTREDGELCGKHAPKREDYDDAR